MKKNNMATKYILLLFLKFSFINKRWTLIYFGKQTVKLKKDFTKVLRVGLRFDFNLQYRSIYAFLKLLAQFSFASAFLGSL